MCASSKSTKLCALLMTSSLHLYACRNGHFIVAFPPQLGRFMRATATCIASIVVAIFCSGDQDSMRAKAACRKDLSRTGSAITSFQNASQCRSVAARRREVHQKAVSEVGAWRKAELLYVPVTHPMQYERHHDQHPLIRTATSHCQPSKESG